MGLIRKALVLCGGLLLAVALSPPTRADDTPAKIRIGYAVALSGPYAQGAESTTWSQYKMWAKDVNDAGGIMLSKYNKKVPVELIEYDDRSQLEEATKLIERLILNDKVDFVLPPWGTATNLAVAPLFNKYEYPAILWTVASMTAYDLSAQWPWTFWGLAQPDEAMVPIVDYIAQLKKEGKIEGKVALIRIADQIGVELGGEFVKEAEKQKVEIVYDKSYPIGVSDLSNEIREMARLNPDAMIGISYPPDTFMLTEQSQVLGFSPKIYYTAIGTVFPGFYGKFGKKAEGVLSFGANDPNAAGFKEYAERHIKMWNRPTEAGAAGQYAMVQVLQQAIEHAGEIDRKKVRDSIAHDKFNTIIGEVTFEKQLLVKPWAVGQWQNGELVGVFPADKSGAKPVMFPKPAW